MRLFQSWRYQDSRASENQEVRWNKEKKLKARYSSFIIPGSSSIFFFFILD